MLAYLHASATIRRDMKGVPNAAGTGARQTQRKKTFSCERIRASRHTGDTVYWVAV